MSNQPEPAVNQQIQKLVGNLFRVFGDYSRSASEFVGTSAFVGIGSKANLAGEVIHTQEASNDRYGTHTDAEVHDLCVQIADECARIRRFQQQMGYYPAYSPEAHSPDERHSA
ncbi:MAG: hypothetical protein VW274_05190 [Thalassolituus sp.]